LLLASRKRPCCRTAEQRDELALFQLIEWHRCSRADDSIADWRGAGQALAALRDFDLANFSSRSISTDQRCLLDVRFPPDRDQIAARRLVT
jgi:hypothetical protein